MIVYSFQEGIPEDFQPDFDVGIFHQQKHLLLQSTQGLTSFVIIDNERKLILGLVYYHIQDNIAKSPLRSPYGSYLFSPKISGEVLVNFMAFTEERMKEKGVYSMILKNSPDTYSPGQHKLLQEVLFQKHYHVQLEEISAIIPVTDDPFELHLHRSEKKRLRKCYDGGLVFEMISLDHLSVIYNFLKTCKDEKGYELSMSLEELLKTSTMFPSHFYLSRVTLHDELIAANISIKVNAHVLYNFYHDHSRAYNLLSPVVLLNEGLYQFCQENRIKLLDLGTSTLNGTINKSLLNFKLRLGALPSRKLTFVKNF